MAPIFGLPIWKAIQPLLVRMVDSWHDFCWDIKLALFKCEPSSDPDEPAELHHQRFEEG